MPIPVRTSLTKSLHTVTVVSRIAASIERLNPEMDIEVAVRDALETIGQPNDWPRGDVTFAACVRATEALVKASYAKLVQTIEASHRTDATVQS